MYTYQCNTIRSITLTNKKDKGTPNYHDVPLSIYINF